MKWIRKIGEMIAWGILYFSVIVFVLPVWGIKELIFLPKHKKQYKNSRYFLDLQIPFSLKRFYSMQYEFYNSARKRNLPFEYFVQSGNDFEYFVYDNKVFVFPDFCEVEFDKDKAVFFAGYKKHKELWSDAVNSLREKIEDNTDGLEIKVLVERDMIDAEKINKRNLPENMFLVDSVGTAFSEDVFPIQKKPRTISALFDWMTEQVNVCGKIELENGSIYWHPYKSEFYISVFFGEKNCDVYLSRDKWPFFSLIHSVLYHWQVSKGDVCPLIESLNDKNNILIIKANLCKVDLLYLGQKEKCPYLPLKKKAFVKFYSFKVSNV